MTNPEVPSLPTLFTTAAWLHARSFMTEKGFVPDVMILGRYSDEEMMFVFPSSQDKDAFARACATEAEAFGADIAIIIGEAEWARPGEAGQPIVRLFVRERGQPMRCEMAFIAEASETTPRAIGVVSSVPGPHLQAILDTVWPNALH